jgi:anti-sigma factor RsiW
MTEQCPSDEDLAAFTDGRVSPDERARIEGHLSRCATCREIVVFAVRMKDTIPDSTPPKTSFN